MGRPPRLSDSEPVCLAVARTLLGCHSEARWLRFARARLSGAFPYLPQQPGYNQRLHSALPLIKPIIRELAADTAFWSDTVWITDSPRWSAVVPVLLVKRSDLAGWAGYGYCRSRSRFHRGQRLFLVCTPAGTPIT